MNIPCYWRRILTFILLIIPIFTLAACGNFSFVKWNHPVSSKSTQADQYVLTEALAVLALEKDQNDKKLLKSYTKNLNARGSEKKRESQIAVVSFEYTLNGQSEKRDLLVPVPVSTATPSFSALQQVQRNLSALPYTLHNLHAYYVTVSFPPSQKFSDDTSLLRRQLGDERQKMLDEATPLSSYENAQLQLQLVQFFMNVRMRDAAYLALENAKDTLAYLAENTSDVDITSLSHKADMLEAQLHKEMPYKL
jgi:hypothetical protein